MEINYNTLIEKIEETINRNYDCSILMFLANDVLTDEKDFQLGYDFFPLLLYFDTLACNDKIRFQELINFLYSISKERNIDSFDVNYILNKEEIIATIDEYKLGFITKDILVKKLKKYFFVDDISNLLDLFEKRENIIIIL